MCSIQGDTHIVSKSIYVIIWINIHSIYKELYFLVYEVLFYIIYDVIYILFI